MKDTAAVFCSALSALLSFCLLALGALLCFASLCFPQSASPYCASVSTANGVAEFQRLVCPSGLVCEARGLLNVLFFFLFSLTDFLQ